MESLSWPFKRTNYTHTKYEKNIETYVYDAMTTDVLHIFIYNNICEYIMRKRFEFKRKKSISSALISNVCLIHIYFFIFN